MSKTDFARFSDVFKAATEGDGDLPGQHYAMDSEEAVVFAQSFRGIEAATGFPLDPEDTVPSTDAYLCRVEDRDGGDKPGGVYVAIEFAEGDEGDYKYGVPPKAPTLISVHYAALIERFTGVSLFEAANAGTLFAHKEHLSVDGIAPVFMTGHIGGRLCVCPTVPSAISQVFEIEATEVSRLRQEYHSLVPYRRPY